MHVLLSQILLMILNRYIGINKGKEVNYISNL